MSLNFGLFLEFFVAILLAITIVYCFLLNKRLMSLRADEQLMRQTIRDLCVSIDNAEMAVDKLSKATADRESVLRSLVHTADETTQIIKNAQSEALDILGSLRQQTVFSNEILKQLKTEPNLKAPSSFQAPSTAHYAEQNSIISTPSKIISSIIEEQDSKTATHFAKFSNAIEKAQIELNTNTPVMIDPQLDAQKLSSQKRKPFSAPFNLFKRDVA